MRMRSGLIGLGLMGSTLIGGALGAALLNGTASAADNTTTTAAATAPAPPADGQRGPGGRGGPGGQQGDPSQGGHVGANGAKEVLLTGDTATKVTDAAKAAVPGATVLRVENDVDEDSPYEAHVRKADGSMATVLVGADFKVTQVLDH